MNANLSLLITNSKDATSDYLLSRCQAVGLKIFRIDTDNISQLPRFLFRNFQVSTNFFGKKVSPEDIKTIIYRRPKPIESNKAKFTPHEYHQAKECSEFWENFLSFIPEKRWINFPWNNAKASRKILQLKYANDYGFLTPKSLATSDKEAAIQFLDSLESLAIVKPIASGYIEYPDPHNDTQIFTNEFNSSHYSYLDQLNACPVLFQEKIDKAFDVRVTVVDSNFCAIKLVKTDDQGRQILDIRRDSMRNVSYSTIALPKEIQASLHGILEHFRLRFAAVDFVVDRSGKWFFLEINPNGQWAWFDLEGVADIGSLFISALGAEIK